MTQRALTAEGKIEVIEQEMSLLERSVEKLQQEREKFISLVEKLNEERKEYKTKVEKLQKRNETIFSAQESPPASDTDITKFSSPPPTPNFLFHSDPVKSDSELSTQPKSLYRSFELEESPKRSISRTPSSRYATVAARSRSEFQTPYPFG